MGKRKQPLPVIDFGFAPQKVIDEFAVKFENYTLAEALELALLEKDHIKGLYEFMPCDNPVSWMTQTTEKEDQVRLEAALENLNEFVKKFRIDGRAAALEMLLFCNKPVDEKSKEICLKENEKDDILDWTIEINGQELNETYLSDDDYIPENQLVPLEESDLVVAEPTFLTIIEKKKRKYQKRLNPDGSPKTRVRKKKLIKQIFECKTCGKDFPFPSSLVVHERTHTGEKPYICNDCGKSFTQKGGLDAHLKIHQAKQYFCESCGLAFATNRALKDHSRIHTGDRPYVCEHCGASYSRKSSLNEHVTLHTGEKPYSCSFCGRAFRKYCSKTKHERIHADNKPFVCVECGKGFTQKYNLKVHVRSHEKRDKQAEERQQRLADMAATRLQI
uniref:Zinc finger protein 782 n=1 Tax=Phallusia mammillata TaxID=59560 RepID=A0A6F9DYE7_9ASCI|nr:zinc finger protein 782 [Phallusia mammillata]